ncbi:MAG TPA: hypothetical protein VGC42_24765 [Kofleriaceae bacterium]
MARAARTGAVAAADTTNASDAGELASATPPPSIDGKGTLINTYA